MVFQNLTMNISGLSDINPPNISVGDISSFDSMVNISNSLTNELLIFFSLTVIGVIIYLALTDSSPSQNFGYDYMRGLNIVFVILSVLSTVIVEVGWSPNFYAVGMMTTLWLVSYLGVLMVDNSE